MQGVDTVIGTITFTDARDEHQTAVTNGSITFYISRSQWPCCLRRRSATARLLRLRVRIQPGARMFISCECCVPSGRGLCDELITRTEAVLPTMVRRCECPRNLKIWWPWPALRLIATGKNVYIIKTLIFT